MAKRDIGHWNWCSISTTRAGGTRFRSRDLLRCGQVARNVDDGVIGQNAPATFAEQDLVSAPQVLKELRAQSDPASLAAPVRRICDGRVLRLFADSFVS